MEHQDNFFSDDISPKKSSTKIDDFASLKNANLDFLSNERNENFEKFDAEKPKKDVDDFLNFHDDVGDIDPQPPQPVEVPSIPSIQEKIHHDEIEDDQNTNEPEAEIDFHALEDDYLNPYASSKLSKGVDQPQNEKFISSEDLLTDFKDPAPAPVEAPKVEKIVEPPMPEKVEPPKPVASVAVEKQPPVSTPVVVEEAPKPKPAPTPTPTPVKPQTSADTQIEAEKIFTSIGLG